MAESCESHGEAPPHDRECDDVVPLLADGGARPDRTDSSPPAVSAPVAPEEQSDEGEPLVTRLRRGLLYASGGALALSLVAALLRRLLARFESDAEPAESDPTPTVRERMPPDAEVEIEEREEDDETDVGALLGLALLALVAALVRRFGKGSDGASSG